MPTPPPSYRRAALFNLRNAGFLFAGATAWMVTGSHWVGGAVAGLELLWLAVAPGVRPFRAAVDRDAAERARRQARKEIQRQAAALPQADWSRAQALEELRRELEQQMARNPTFTRVVLEPEVDKLQALHAAFVSLASACAAADAHAASPDGQGLPGQLAAARAAVEAAGADETARSLAQQNVAVLERRLQRLEDARTFVGRARAQMGLIENSVRLLKDQALTLTNPAEVTDQLDDLLHGVDALRKVMDVDEGLSAGAAARSRVRG
jgi:hypothetical protein